MSTANYLLLHSDAERVGQDDIKFASSMPKRRDHTMQHQRSKAILSDLAKQAGAEPAQPWTQRLLRSLRRRWKMRKRHASGLVMFASDDAPRDLDDPLSDPKVQSRIGASIAKLGQRQRRGA